MLPDALVQCSVDSSTIDNKDSSEGYEYVRLKETINVGGICIIYEYKCYIILYFIIRVYYISYKNNRICNKIIII